MGVAGRKLDLTKGSIVAAHANGLWPHLTDVARWTHWLRDARGRGGLERVDLLAPTGAVDPLQPELGRRFRFRFTTGFEGEFKVVYWQEPAQISIELIRETRKDARGLEGLIFDLDFFPQADGTTKVWFGALAMLEPGVRPGFLASWPKRDLQSWVDGFHRRLIAEGPALAGDVRTRKQMEAAATKR